MSVHCEDACRVRYSMCSVDAYPDWGNCPLELGVNENGVAGIPMMENKNHNFIVNLIRRSSMIFRYASFPTFPMFEIMRFPKLIYLKMIGYFIILILLSAN